MDKFKEQFLSFFTSFRDMWSKTSWEKKGIFIGTIVVILSAIIFVVVKKSTPDNGFLYTDLNAEDTQAISEELKKMGIADYNITPKGIVVPSAQIIPLRLKLAESGLPSQGQIGWEKFDQQDFTRTEFEQNVHKLRAVQGELARTINSIEGVISSRVHIVTPKQSLFIEDAKEPTAAIYLKTKRGVQLSQKQINGIVHLTSRSIEGLRPEMITIIDQEGKMLTKVESDDPTSKRTQEMLGFRRNIEKELEERVRTMVSRIVGPDRVEVKIDADIDFTSEEQTINDIDPDKVVVLSSNSTNQEMDGSGLNPTGIPGSKSNVPGEQEDISVATNKSKSLRTSERLNYEIAKTKKVRVLPVGELRRITAAVLVNGKQEYPLDGAVPKFEARTKEELAQIEDLVKSAIGFQQKRGDEVIVRNMLFTLGPIQLASIKETKEDNRNYIVTISMAAASAIAIVFFFAFMVRPYLRWLSYDPNRKKTESIIEEFKPELEIANTQALQVKEDTPFEKMTPHEQVMFLAKNEPQRTTEALRMILNPHHSAK